MIKNLLLILFVCSTFCFSSAQASSDWKIFSAKNEEFTLESPNQLKYVGIILRDVAVSPDNERKYYDFSNGVNYYVFSQNLDDRFLTKLLIEQAKVNKATVETFTSSQFEEKKFCFTDSDGFHQIVFLVKTKKRQYVFHTVSTNQNIPDLTKFFSTIKINGVNLSKIPNEFSNSLRPNNDSITDNKTNTDKSSKDASNVNSSSVTPIKFSKKPRANYTDLARIYQVSGSIKLKVTFLANGTVGEIIPLNRLPFGLTLQAINAAKGLKFESQKENGIAVTITKQVEYTFTLY